MLATTQKARLVLKKFDALFPDAFRFFSEDVVEALIKSLVLDLVVAQDEDYEVKADDIGKLIVMVREARAERNVKILAGGR